MILSSASLLMCLFYYYQNKKRIKLYPILIPLGVYFICVLLSTTYSRYKDIAVWGYTHRFEGFIVITCYIVICFLAATFITYQSDIKILFSVLICCSSILGLLGVSQFFGFDFLQTQLGKLLILPEQYHHIASEIAFNFPINYIYLTLYNPNYVGSFCAMLFPVSLLLVIYAKKHLHTLFAIIFSCLIFVNLLGCRSSTGYIAAGIALITAVILLRSHFFKTWRSLLVLLACYLVLFVFMNYTSGGVLSAEFSSLNLDSVYDKEQVEKRSADIEHRSSNIITDVYFNGNILEIHVNKKPLFIYYDKVNKQCVFKDSQNNTIELKYSSENEVVYSFDDIQYADLSFIVSGAIIEFTAPNFELNVAISVAEDCFKLVNSKGQVVDVKNAEFIGFEGKERWLSSRGFIWSRSLPMIKDTMFIGHGPDTYALFFPQDDVSGKIKAYGMPYIAVDNPHNMYLQMAINTGLLSFIAFLIFVCWFIIEAIRLYFKPKNNNLYSKVGIGCMLAVIGFLVAGLANDSTISVSPVFWIVIGTGISCNRLYSQQINKLNSK